MAEVHIYPERTKMLRAMNSAVAGLRAHQNKLDVIGNNIANVNTDGYKSQSYSFMDSVYQTVSSSSGGTNQTSSINGVGGTNAIQYGYGALTGSISTDMTAGSPTYVGGFNASINGTGFFITGTLPDTVDLGAEVSTDAKDTTVTSQRSEALKTSELKYTRVGQFNLDANGYVVDANGNYVFGYAPSEGTLNAPTNYDTRYLVALRAPLLGKTGDDECVVSDSSGNSNFYDGTTEAQQITSITLDDDGTIKGTIDSTGNPQTVVIGTLAIANFQNETGLTKSGNNTFTSEYTDNTGIATATMPGGATATLMAGYLESSNVDLATEFSDMITTERGYQANTKIITVSDEVLQEIINMKR